MRLKLFIILFSLSFSADNISIKNRLLVPAYLKYGFIAGYNDNIFKFSNTEKESDDSYDYMGEALTYDSSIAKFEIKLLYSPHIFDNNITNLIFYTNISDYSHVKDKSSQYYSLRFEYKINSYNWIKLGYKNSQNNFLRYYIDDDIPDNDYLKCDYDSETIYLNYSINLHDYGWSRIQYSKTNQFYNPNFTEFDLDIASLSLNHNYKYQTYNLSITLSAIFAKNISYNNGLNSTSFDRSYDSSELEVVIKKDLDKFLNRLSFGYSIGTRLYISESESDPLHSGRSHVDNSFFIAIRKELRYDMNMELKYKLRYRKTDSDFDWVESLKSFADNEIVIRFTYEMEMDLFY